MILKYRLLLCLFSFLTFKASNAQSTYNQRIPGSEVSFKMALIPSGELVYESSNIEVGEPITIQVDSFWIGVHEVTFDEFILFQDFEKDTDSTLLKNQIYKVDAVTRPTPQYEDYSKGMGRHGGYPVTSMTQQGALRYCQWLYQKTGVFYRLPTEAEWEMACQMSEKEAEELEGYAWFFDNSYEKFHKTGEKKPNEFGLHDMLGNVAEWTLDHYTSEYPERILEADENLWIPTWIIPSKKHFRTVKGGAYDDNAEACQCAARQKSKAKWQARDPQIPKSKWWNPDSPFVGFRLARSMKTFTHEEIEAFFKTAIID